MCITIINSSSSTRADEHKGDPRTGSNTSRAFSRLPSRQRTPTQSCFSERRIRRVKLICSSQASDIPSSIQDDRKGSSISESSTSTDSVQSSAKKRCKLRREGQETQHPLPDIQATESAIEHISSLSDKVSLLRTSRRGRDGHYLSLHSETFRLLDFEDDDDESDDEDFHM